MLKLLMRSAFTLKPSFHPSESGLKIRERAISDFSRKIIEDSSNMNEKKIMSFEDYKQKHCDSLEDYIKSVRPAFPEKTDEMFKETHQRVCKAEYRAYKNECENPGRNPGLMLTSDFFEEKDPK
ncbi:MAG: hypothetical protein JSS09_00230 [Verrucomicrobia bacterium]|nr:hypothetical protein [Verrucomicrobiota bacterium]